MVEGEADPALALAPPVSPEKCAQLGARVCRDYRAQPW